MKSFNKIRHRFEKIKRALKVKGISLQVIVDSCVQKVKQTNITFGLSLFTEIERHCKQKLKCDNTVFSGPIFTEIMVLNRIQDFGSAISNKLVNDLLKQHVLRSPMERYDTLSDHLDWGVHTAYVQTCSKSQLDRRLLFEKSRSLCILLDDYFDMTFVKEMTSLLNREAPKNVVELTIGTKIQRSMNDYYPPDVNDHYSIEHLKNGKIMHANTMQLYTPTHPLFVVHVDGAEDEEYQTYIEINIPVTFHFPKYSVTTFVHVIRIGIFSPLHPLENYKTTTLKISELNLEVKSMTFRDMAENESDLAIAGVLLALHYIYEDNTFLSRMNEFLGRVAEYKTAKKIVNTFNLTVQTYELSKIIQRTNVSFITPQVVE